eukprot:gene12615-14584_t
MAIRSAEASRKSTCLFADRVAELSITFYRNICPSELLEAFDQTVLATIVVQKTVHCNDDLTEDNKTVLEVVSMGVGTKVVAADEIVSHKADNRVNGDQIVRDCHAEVLARRGFLRYLHNQIRLRLDKSGSMKENDCIFSCLAASDNRLVLKPGVRFHLYTSSQPCGNASIKRWAKVKPLRYREDLSADSFPREPHERIQITPESRQEGQVALLVKRNGRSNATKNTSLVPKSADPAQDRSFITASTVIASEHIPAGTALPTSLEGNVMTCSDKIALWNAIGLQGALLTAVIEPIYLSTITVGRKFSQVHCQRALCCRLQDFQYPHTCAARGKKANKKRNQHQLKSLTEADASSAIDAQVIESAVPAVEETTLVQESEQKVLFSIHHPAMLGTQVKLDEGTIVTGRADAVTDASSVIHAGDKTIAVPAIGARFFEPRCLVSYATYTTSKMHLLEVLDGRTGLLINAPNIENKNISTVSSCSLRAAFEDTYSALHTGDELGSVELESYKALKRRVAPNYAAAKDSLFSDPLTFAEWTHKIK